MSAAFSSAPARAITEWRLSQNSKPITEARTRGLSVHLTV